MRYRKTNEVPEGLPKIITLLKPGTKDTLFFFSCIIMGARSSFSPYSPTSLSRCFLELECL